MKKIIIKKLKNNIELKKVNNKLLLENNDGSIEIYTENKLKLSNKEKKIFINSKKLKNFINNLKNSCNIISNGWFLELTLKGIGFKCFWLNDKIALDLGYSNIIIFKPNKNLKIKIFKNRIVFFGINKNYIKNLCSLLKRYFIIDRYKGKGLILKNDNLKLKQKFSI